VNPFLYEINTRCWLRELSQRQGVSVTLANVPEAELAAWQQAGFTHIWLMGAWTTGPRAREEAFKHADLLNAYNTLLPGWQPEDIAGSCYSIAAYTVPAALGGDEGLKAFRARLHARGMKLILDFVPNHLGFDHPWTAERPELFVQHPTAVPGTFPVETAAGRKCLAHGKDPHFYPWIDTVQVDYRRADARAAMLGTLQAIAARCDGVRCDMAMLLLNEVFAGTWAHFPAQPGSPAPATEFWSDAIPAVKQAQPGFIFLAEVYWSLESRLQSLGFDYTYDKHLFDLLVYRRSPEVQGYLLNSPENYVRASAHFLENHDEQRIASRLSPAEHAAAALLILGLPGMRFLHEGQLTGAPHHFPVQLGRRPIDQPNPDIAALYTKLLGALGESAVGRGEGRLLKPRAAWDGNPTAGNFVVVRWQTRPLEFDLVVVNLAPHDSQCYVPLEVADIATRNWRLRDRLSGERYERYGDDLAGAGLYLDAPAQAAQIFHFVPK
jgi:Alpha amylase, catalytic domain